MRLFNKTTELLIYQEILEVIRLYSYYLGYSKLLKTLLNLNYHKINQKLSFRKAQIPKNDPFANNHRFILRRTLRTANRANPLGQLLGFQFFRYHPSERKIEKMLSSLILSHQRMQMRSKSEEKRKERRRKWQNDAFIQWHLRAFFQAFCHITLVNFGSKIQAVGFG